MNSTRNYLERLIDPIAVLGTGAGFLSGLYSAPVVTHWSAGFCFGFIAPILLRTALKHVSASFGRHFAVGGFLLLSLFLAVICVSLDLSLELKLFFILGCLFGCWVNLASLISGELLESDLLSNLGIPSRQSEASQLHSQFRIQSLFLDLGIFSLLGLATPLLLKELSWLAAIPVVTAGVQFAMTRMENSKFKRSAYFRKLRDPLLFTAVGSTVVLIWQASISSRPTTELFSFIAIAGVISLSLFIEKWIHHPRGAWSKRVAEGFAVDTPTTHLMTTWYSLWVAVFLGVCSLGLIFIFGGLLNTSPQSALMACGTLLGLRLGLEVLGSRDGGQSSDPLAFLALCLVSLFNASSLGVSLATGLASGALLILIAMVTFIRPYLEGSFFGKLREYLLQSDGAPAEKISQKLSFMAHAHARRHGTLFVLLALVFIFWILSQMINSGGIDIQGVQTGWIVGAGAIYALFGTIVNWRRRFNELANEYLAGGALGGKESRAIVEAQTQVRSSLMAEAPLYMALSNATRLALLSAVAFAVIKNLNRIP